jgi:hypothetical protein
MGDRTQQQYQTLTNGEKDFDRTDLNQLNDSPEQVRRQMLAHNLYKTDLRARELLDYSMLELNTDNITNQGKEFNLKEHLQVRSNFDQLFAGKYEKTLDPKVKSYVESKADELYLKETGQKKSDRASQLWKSLRNVEVLKYDRSLWDTVQQTVVEQPRDARDNVLTSPVGSGPKMPGHTGHGVPEKVETGTRAIGEGVRPKIPTNTGHVNNEKAAVTNVFESRAPEYSGGSITESSFLDNIEKFLGSGYTEVSPGRYVSKDGLRQVRYGKHETNSRTHHGHFESYDRPGGQIIENTSVEIIPDSQTTP